MFKEKNLIFQKRQRNPEKPQISQRIEKSLKKDELIREGTQVAMDELYESTDNLINPLSAGEIFDQIFNPNVDQEKIDKILSEENFMKLMEEIGKYQKEGLTYLGYIIEKDDIILKWQDDQKEVIELPVCYFTKLKFENLKPILNNNIISEIEQEKNFRIEKKLTKILSDTGLDKKEIKEILEDETNPYIWWLFQFIEQMEQIEMEYIGITPKKYPKFKFKGQKTGFQMHYFNRALRWKKIIYPRLIEATKGIDYEFVLKIIDINLELSMQGKEPIAPEMEKFLSHLTNYHLIEYGQDIKVKRELLGIKKEKKHNQYKDFNKYEIPKNYLNEVYTNIDLNQVEWDKIDEKIREFKAEIENTELIQKTLPEYQAFESMVDRIDDPKVMTKEELESFTNDTSELRESLAINNPELENLNHMSDQLIEEMPDFFKTEIENGTSQNEIFMKTGVKIDNVQNEIIKLRQKAKEEGNDNLLAAILQYETMLHGNIEAMAINAGFTD